MDFSAVSLATSLKCINHLFTHIRSSETKSQDFRKYSTRLMNIICEEAFALKCENAEIKTPTDSLYSGICQHRINNRIIAITIIRAGDAMLESFLNICPEAVVGKVLVQRDEETAIPKLYYSKVPPILADDLVFLLDPMLATGGSAILAIQEILKLGGLCRNIVFVTVVSCPEGINYIKKFHPEILIVTGEIDAGLNGKNYIVPGLGDFGDRYFGT